MKKNEWKKKLKNKWSNNILISCVDEWINIMSKNREKKMIFFLLIISLFVFIEKINY